MSPNGKLVRKWRYDMSKVSCYGCEHDGITWADECKGCIRMFLKCEIKDRYSPDGEDHMSPALVLQAMTQEFDTKELCLTAEWVMPDDPMWHNPTCSNCDFESADHGAYCPRCGAKMIGFLY